MGKGRKIFTTAILGLLISASGCHFIRRITTPDVMNDEEFKYHHPNIHYQGDQLRFDGAYCNENMSCFCFFEDGRFYYHHKADSTPDDGILVSKKRGLKTNLPDLYGYYEIRGDDIKLHHFQPTTKLEDTSSAFINRDSLVWIEEAFYFREVDTIIDNWDRPF